MVGPGASASPPVCLRLRGKCHEHEHGRQFTRSELPCSHRRAHCGRRAPPPMEEKSSRLQPSISIYGGGKRGRPLKTFNVSLYDKPRSPALSSDLESGQATARGTTWHGSTIFNHAPAVARVRGSCLERHASNYPHARRRSLQALRAARVGMVFQKHDALPDCDDLYENIAFGVRALRARRQQAGISNNASSIPSHTACNRISTGAKVASGMPPPALCGDEVKEQHLAFQRCLSLVGTAMTSSACCIACTVAVKPDGVSCSTSPCSALRSDLPPPRSSGPDRRAQGPTTPIAHRDPQTCSRPRAAPNFTASCISASLVRITATTSKMIHHPPRTRQAAAVPQDLTITGPDRLRLTRASTDARVAAGTADAELLRHDDDGTHDQGLRRRPAGLACASSPRWAALAESRSVRRLPVAGAVTAHDIAARRARRRRLTPRSTPCSLEIERNGHIPHHPRGVSRWRVLTCARSSARLRVVERFSSASAISA